MEIKAVALLTFMGAIRKQMHEKAKLTTIINESTREQERKGKKVRV